MKKILMFLVALMISTYYFQSNTSAVAKEFVSGSIEFVSSTSFIDIENNELYIFQSPEDMSLFLNNNTINSRTSLSSVCLPGSPGYPTCGGNPVISSYSTFVRSYINTRYSHNLAVSVKGPGTVTISKSTGISIDGISVGKSTGASFSVPSGKFGNIILAAQIKNDVYQTMYKHKDGSISKGNQYTKKSLVTSWYQLKTW